MPYCIYTDTEVPTERGNLDHVIPMSLGGSDSFTVWASKAFNSEMGSKIDGKVANDPFVMLARRNSDARGHSGKHPLPVWKRTTLDGNPIQLSLAKDEITGWDPIARRQLPEAELAGREFTTRLEIDRLPSLRFVTKVALAGAHFAYGDCFRDKFDCDPLRRMLTIDLSDLSAVRDADLPLKFVDRWHPDAMPGGRGEDYKFLCEFTNRTTLILCPDDRGMSVHVSVLGMFIASLIIDGDSSSLPLDSDHDLGHVLLLGPGPMSRRSFRSLAISAKEELDAMRQRREPL